MIVWVKSEYFIKALKDLDDPAPSHVRVGVKVLSMPFDLLLTLSFITQRERHLTSFLSDHHFLSHFTTCPFVAIPENNMFAKMTPQVVFLNQTVLKKHMQQPNV